MDRFGFARVAVACPRLKVADVGFNSAETLDLLGRAEDARVDLVAFPECGLTGYTCGDLFHHSTLLDAAREGLLKLAESSKSSYSGVAVVGLPLVVGDSVYNVAAIIHAGRILGVVPKSYLPNYKEFYEARHFAPARNAIGRDVELGGRTVPFGTDLLFEAANATGFCFGVEICEDLWMPVPPSSLQALHGAKLLVNLSASNETIGKSAYRHQLVLSQSARCLAAYLYASSGVGESTTDLVFGGHGLIAENGTLLAESPRFQREATLTIADVDLDHLERERRQTNSFADNRAIHRSDFRIVPFELASDRSRPDDLLRRVDQHPFVPQQAEMLRVRCEEIFATQVAGLAKRIEHIGVPTLSIGISGGLDSTLGLLVAVKTLDLLKVTRKKLRAITMPGFGTTDRTLANSRKLMDALGVAAEEIDIRSQCVAQWKALGHSPFGLDLQSHSLESFGEALKRLPSENRSDLAFENVQARVRTSMLMNAGFAIGTGDLSELALGWCTYNADHMSMYNPNASIPKTLVAFLVRWAANAEFDGAARATLLDIAETVISPELLPVGVDGQSLQSTEASTGPYELVDFFLYHFLRWGTPPEKILFLASKAAFDRDYSPDELRRWLKVFLQKFFANQFKRSCLPDGPKVGSVSLSPRGDWRMPSDAMAKAWLEAI